ncbi:MAG: DNA recombination protein RmuC, partial [Chloroflexota bacterium]|nr:DNA recombination protein RmuC [Chloroflexota bacterium]
NYRKNRQVEGGSGRPDYTFLLPQGRELNMDVKFPLAGYLRYLEAGSEADRETATTAFLRDVRQRVREVTGRDYINTAQGTLDYVLVFIPNEQVYGFIHEHDATIAQAALERRVVLCSPLTLFAVLVVIRQSVESVQLEEHAHEILAALGAFEGEWVKKHEAVLKLGRGLTTTQRAYEDLSGPRMRQMERRLNKVEQLRARAGIEAGAESESGDDPEALRARIDPARR